MYYVVDTATGMKYGPADLTTLNQWIQEKRLLPNTMLEDSSTGMQMMASQVPGLMFPIEQTVIQPQPQPQEPFQPQQPMGGPTIHTPPSGQQGYGQQPYNPIGPTGAPIGYPRMEPSGDVGKWITTGWVMAVLGFICCPVIFNAIGIYYGSKVKNAGNPTGQTLIIVNIVVMILSIGIGAMSGFYTRFGR